MVQFLKRFLKVKKIGHGGTLDPLASGLLIIGVNHHTKQLNYALNSNKTYCATIQLNQQTTTADREGVVMFSNINVTPIPLSNIVNAINHFNESQYEQTPPQYAAIKINGKKLYQYARNHEQIEIPTRTVQIHHLSLIDYTYPHITLRMEVSKGFYVRSFAQDFSAYLLRYGHLIALERTKTHGFVLSESIIDIEHLKQSLMALKHQ